MRRVLALITVLAAVLGFTALPAAAATAPCRPGAGSPTCQVWTGRVDWVPDGDTLLIFVNGAKKSTSIRMLGVQAMEQSAYSKDPGKRRGECHALAATARVEYLVRAGGGKVRLTAQHAVSSNRDRPLRSIAVRINGRWVDIGLDLVRNGYVLWLPMLDEYAWNTQYRAAAQLAARDGRNLYDTDACGSGPHQAAKLSMTVNYDPPGADDQNLNGEWFRVDNASTTAVPLGGWWVRDAALRRYTFPAGTVVAPGGSVFVHVGKGTATATHKYWGQPSPVFDNPTFDATAHGDGGYLFDPRGDLRAWMLYPCVVAC